MYRRSFFGIWVCILAIWMQLFAPAAAMEAMQRQQTAAALAVICSHSADTGDGQAGQHGGGHAHHHCCILCQHHLLAGLLPDGRPSFTTFDYPIAGPLRWRFVVVSVATNERGSLPQPRGPPVLV